MAPTFGDGDGEKVGAALERNVCELAHISFCFCADPRHKPTRTARFVSRVGLWIAM